MMAGTRSTPRRRPRHGSRKSGQKSNCSAITCGRASTTKVTGLGENVALAIAPGAGYVFECHGCVGLYDRNYGAAEWKNERLRLAFTFENRRKGFKGIAEEFIPVAWGPRKYLIPAAGVIGFCNDVNCGREPRKAAHGRYLLRCGDEEKRVTGLPTLPPEFQAYALRQPITAEIVAVGSRTTRPQPVLGGTEVIDTVTLGVGKKGGLLPGMKLYTTASEMDSDAVEVMTVDEEKAEGKLTRHYLFLPYSRPSVGWKLSTRIRSANGSPRHAKRSLPRNELLTFNMLFCRGALPCQSKN